MFEHFPQRPTAQHEAFPTRNPISPADIDDKIAATDLHSTSDALNLLSQAAQLDAHQPSRHSHAAAGSVIPSVHSRHTVVHNAIDDLLEYPLVPQGLLTTAQVVQLVAR